MPNDCAVTDSERRVVRWLSKLAPSTRTQYEVYLRGLRGAIESKRVEKASRADVLRYLRGLPSHWMRRRGLSALRGCFAAAGADDPTSGITIGVLRGRNRTERTREALVREGWSARRIGAVTWGELAATAFADRASARGTRAALVAFISEAFPGRTLVVDFARRADRRAFAAQGSAEPRKRRR